MKSIFDEFTKFDRFMIGSDQFMKQIGDMVNLSTKTLTNFPPYNIKKVSDNRYVIEMAVAGFGKQDIDIELNDNTLVIKGNSSNDDEDSTYLYKGLADRAFTRQFKLAENIEVKNADLINGVLKVWLDFLAPQITSKKIDINDSETNTPKSDVEFLVEETKEGK